MYEAVHAAVERARRGEGPSLVEVVTYRFNEHSEGLRLGVDYRDKDEKAAWLERDPIVLFRRWLVEHDVATEEQLDALDAEVRARGRRVGGVHRREPLPGPVARLRRPLHRTVRAHPRRARPRPPDRSRPMTVMSYLGAIGAAQREAMQADERVVIIGEDVEANVYGTTGGSGKSRAASGDFLEMFGANRIRNTPISEEVIVGACARRGDDRAAPDRGPVLLVVPVHGDGPVREPGRQEPLHVRRAGVDAGRVPLGDVLRAQHRRAPLRPAVPDVHERARPQDRRARFAQGREGPAAHGRRLRRPGAHLRGLHAVGHQGGRARGGVPHPVRPGPHRARRLRRHDRGDLQLPCRRPSRRPTSWPSRASRSR